MVESMIEIKLLEELESLIRESKINFFYGAGISHASPSSLPLANELKLNIVERLVGPDRVLTITDRLDKVPLELVIEVIDRNSAKFMPALGKLFHSGQPNWNHLFLASLITKGLLKSIMTTNFDTQLEKALARLSSLNYTTYSNENAFSYITQEDLSRPSIVKVHGTADDIASMRSTVQQIARPRNSEARKRAISCFFQETGKSILILGYGARDDFDINPCLRSLKPLHNGAKIYFVKHQHDETFEMRPLADPFTNFDGAAIFCNTGRLLSGLGKRLSPEIDSTQTPEPPKWQQFLTEWDAEIDSTIRLALAAEISETIGDLQGARQLHIETLEKWPDDVNRMKTMVNLGNVEEMMGLFDDAEQHFKTSFETAQKFGDEFAKAAILQHLGQLAYQRKDYPAAFVLTRQSEEIFKRQYDEARRGVSAVDHQLGMILSGMGLASKAEGQLQKSLQESIELGDLDGQAKTLAQLGLVYREQKKFTEALKVFREAKTILEELCNTDSLNRINGDIAEVMREAESS
jgi:tetratricopeptide (TPR) repeat protein